MRVDRPRRHASDRCQVGHRPAAPALLFNETRRNSACHCGNPASGTVPLRGPDHGGRGRNARLLPAELGGLVWVPHPFCRVASRRRSRALLRTAGTLRPDRQRCEGSRDARPVERAAQVREIVGERGSRHARPTRPTATISDLFPIAAVRMTRFDTAAGLFGKGRLADELCITAPR